MNAVTQAEFARLVGVARSYVTALKKDGRIVLNAIGNVLVEESKRRILETADPNRDDVVSRWAKARGETTIAATKEPEADEPESPTFANARARKEHAAADIAEMERDKLRGQLVERVAVEVAVEDVMTIVRQALEQQPHRVAPMLVGQDLDAIRALLKQENNAALAGMVREFQQRIRQMAGEEE